MVFANDMSDVILFQPMTEIFDRLKSGPTLPLSLLSAVRLAAQEFDIKLVDQRLDRRWRSTMEREARNGAWVAAITSVTGRQLVHAAKAAKHAMGLGMRVVWGGVHATLLGEQILLDGLAHVVVRGEGEITMLELLKALEQGSDLENVRGISFLRGSDVIRTPDREFADLSELPDVPYHLAGAKYLFSRKGRKAVYFETSRGCPNSCKYCYNTTFHRRRWRPEKPASVIARLERLKHTFPQVRHISLVDDNFLTRRSRALEIARLLVESGLGFTYQVQGVNVNDVDRLSDQDLSLLKRSGCERLDMGVESGSERILSMMGKRLDLDAVPRVNQRLKRHGITPWYNFMTGFPGETLEDVKATIRLALKLTKENPDALVSPFYCLAPYPGTAMFEQAKSLGVRFPESTEEWGRFSLDRPIAPDMSEVEWDKLSRLYFFSIFMDRKVQEYDTFPGISVLASMYRPVARFRLSRFILAPAPEKSIFEFFAQAGHKGSGTREP